MITRKMLLASCAVGVMGVMASPAFAQSAQGGTPSDANAAAAGQAAPPPPGAPGASTTGAETGTPGATGTSTGSAITGDTAARANQRDTTGANNSVQEVVVTAEKRSVSLQRIPAAVTAFTSEKRDLIGITTVQDLTNFTPGLQYSTQIDRPSLRGIGRLTNVQSAQSPLATYSDGVYTTSLVDAGKSPLFVDREEVLRGPQGTLYGRNAIAGAINVISRRPTNEWYAEARVRGENYGRSVVEAAVSGPIIKDFVSFRLAASWDKQREGWINNIVPGQPDEGNVIDQKYYEGQLKFKFNDRLEGWFKLGAYVWNNGSGGPGGRYSWYRAPYSTFESGNITTNLVLNPGFGLQTAASLAAAVGPAGALLAPTGVVNQNPLGAVNPQLSDPRKIASITPYRIKLDNTYLPAGELIYHANNFDVKYVGGGVRYHYYEDVPPNPNAAPVSQYNIRAIAGPGAGTSLTVFPSYTAYYQEVLEWQSHELNIISTNKGPFQYVLGAYYFGEHEDQPVVASLPQQAQLASPSGATCPPSPLLPTPGFNGVCPPNTNRAIYDDTPSINIKSKAAFAQFDWEFLPTFKATAGVRYTKDEENGTETGRLLSFGAPTNTPAQFLGAFTPALDLTQVPAAIARTGGPGVVGALTFDPATGYATRRYDASWDAVTGTAGLQWTPNRGTLVYGKYSRGYKAGGYRLGIDVIFPSNPETDPEHVNAYELGFKKSWLDRTLTTNVSAFYYDYQNAQIPITIAASSATAASNSILFNVPKSVSQGIELETVWNPIHNLSLLFNYSYLDAHVTRGAQIDPIDPTATQPGARPLITLAQCYAGYNAATGASSVCPLDIYTQISNPAYDPTNPASPKFISTPTGGFQRTQELKNASLPNAATHKIAFNANYTINTGMGDFIVSGSYTWRSEQFGSLFDRSYYRAPGSGQLDARVTFRDKKDKYTIIAYGRNLTDEILYEGGAFGIRDAGYLPTATAIGAAPSVGGVYSGYYLGAPRTYGIELQYRFF